MARRKADHLDRTKMTPTKYREKDAASAPNPSAALARAITVVVMACSRFRWLVLALSILATILAAQYVAGHFRINANTSEFLSKDLEWRRNLRAIDDAFPQRVDQIVVVIDGKTPELAEAAAAALAKTLEGRPDLFSFVLRPDGGPYFSKEGLLFLPTEEVRRTVQGLTLAQPFLVALSADPTLRGIADAFSFINRGVRAKAGTFDDFDRPIVALSGALEDLLAGRPATFSWRSLVSGEPPGAFELRKFILVKPKLDYAALQPGEVPSRFIRESSRVLGLEPQSGVTVRLTGQVPLADEEFASLEQGAELNAVVTALLVILIVWGAVKSGRIVFAVIACTAVGLAITAAVGLMMVGALNLISVAFAVLFVGIGVDFAIQFSVRYRSERHREPDFAEALAAAATKAGRPLALAAAAAAAGFYSFLPTDYRGISELGLIAGTGMFVAFFCAITVLPALLTVQRPPAETAPVGFAFLAPFDDVIARHRRAILFVTLAVALGGTPLLRDVRFDFNPINLKSPKAESVATLRDLTRDPSTDPRTIEILQPSRKSAEQLAERLRQLPEVARVTTFEDLVPKDQDEKLAIIAPATRNLLPLLDPARALDAPTDADDVAALEKAADAFSKTAAGFEGKGADDARKLAGLLRKLAAAPPDVRQAARAVLLPSLGTMLEQLRSALSPEKASGASLPQNLVRDWIAPDGRARISIAPAGDPGDNATSAHFVAAVQKIAPEATGEPVAVLESGRTVVRAFIQAGLWALISISLLLFVVLRRVTDVLLTLAPLVLAGVVTLEITVLIGLPLNFANIIALPLLLGLGVAFVIYFVMAWRAGTKNLLQSSLTRAVFFSAMVTATAFGSLWLSNHPGTSSMGALLALSLVVTLAAAVLFQPALMGPPRKTGPHDEGA
jgi:hopanoid biosynthesis associated RND transporter like protein HpnN